MGERRRNYIYNTDRRGLGASACAGAGARLRGGSRRGLSLGERNSRAWGAERERSRALRNYACDAMQRWET
eukprot:4465639-Pleurochrysis_carterae.AAC.1